jgi:hypothetical protein
MYAEGYFTGICREALKVSPTAAAESSSTRRAQGLGPAETAAGQACDREVVGAYAAKLKTYADEIAAAMGEEPPPLDDEINLWPVVALLAVVAVGGGAYYVWDRYYRDEPPTHRAPMRRNAGRAEWKALYKTTCGDDREARRVEARQLESGARVRSEEQTKADRAEAAKARRVSTREGRKAETLRARADARKAELVREVDELRAAAERPCDDAKEELRRRTEREEREASERRTPAQREASRRTLERIAEEIEREAGEVEHVISREHGAEMGRLARRQFEKRGRQFIAKARRAHRDTTAAELGIEAFEENLDNMRALLSEQSEKSDADYSDEEAAYWREREAG